MNIIKQSVFGLCIAFIAMPLVGMSSSQQDRQQKENKFGMAVETNNQALVKAVLGADPTFANTASPEGVTVLMLASRNGNSDLVNILLNAGANVNAQSFYFADKPLSKVTALFLATQSNHLEVMRTLLQHHADPNLKTSTGGTPLLTACNKEYYEAIRLLLKHDADANIQNNDGMTPLMTATLRGTISIIRLLLENGAHMDIPDFAGKTVIDLAIQFHQAASVQVLLEYSLIYAAADGDRRVVKTILYCGKKYKININVQTEEGGSTALLEATYNGYTDIVVQLLANGADSNIKNALGVNAFMIAAMNGRLDIVELLIKQVKNINEQSNKGYTALMLSVGPEDNSKVIEFLCAHGADVNITTKSSHSALSMACIEGTVEQVKILLKHGARIDMPGSRQDVFMQTADLAFAQVDAPRFDELLLILRELLPYATDEDKLLTLKKAEKEGITPLIDLLKPKAKRKPRRKKKEKATIPSSLPESIEQENTEIPAPIFAVKEEAGEEISAPSLPSEIVIQEVATESEPLSSIALEKQEEVEPPISGPVPLQYFGTKTISSGSVSSFYPERPFIPKKENLPASAAKMAAPSKKKIKTKVPVMKGEEMIDVLVEKGFQKVRQTGGSHVQLKNPLSGKHTTVPVHSKKPLGRKLTYDILKQAGLTCQDLD